jgi:hypothetical protein
MPSLETLRTLHFRMQQQSYTIGGQDWRRLFRWLDANHDGRIERAEFCRAMRHTLRIAPREVRFIHATRPRLAAWRACGQCLSVALR